MRPLFAITEDLIKLNDILDECEGDLSKLGMAEHEINQWLDGLGAEESAKLDAYVGLIKQLKMEAVAAKAEKEQWAKRQASREDRAEFLADRLKQHLEMAKRTKVTTEKGTVIAIQKDGGEVPIEWNNDAFETMTPGEIATLESEGYVVLNPMIDKAMVRKGLSEGKEFAFAKIGERGTHLRIK